MKRLYQKAKEYVSAAKDNVTNYAMKAGATGALLGTLAGATFGIFPGTTQIARADGTEPSTFESRLEGYGNFMGFLQGSPIQIRNDAQLELCGVDTTKIQTDMTPGRIGDIIYSGDPSTINQTACDYIDVIQNEDNQQIFFGGKRYGDVNMFWGTTLVSDDAKFAELKLQDVAQYSRTRNKDNELVEPEGITAEQITERNLIKSQAMTILYPLDALSCDHSFDEYATYSRYTVAELIDFAKGLQNVDSVSVTVNDDSGYIQRTGNKVFQSEGHLASDGKTLIVDGTDYAPKITPPGSPMFSQGADSIDTRQVYNSESFPGVTILKKDMCEDYQNWTPADLDTYLTEYGRNEIKLAKHRLMKNFETSAPIDLLARLNLESDANADSCTVPLIMFDYAKPYGDDGKTLGDAFAAGDIKELKAEHFKTAVKLDDAACGINAALGLDANAVTPDVFGFASMPQVHYETVEGDNGGFLSLPGEISLAIGTLYNFFNDGDDCEPCTNGGTIIIEKEPTAPQFSGNEAADGEKLKQGKNQEIDDRI